jgi:hypothetical protein
MPVIQMVPPKKLNEKSVWLSRRRGNFFSQNGEDGVVQALFEAIGERHKWCVEFGAWDGVHLSNTCNLIRNHGWFGVQIEGDSAKFPKLLENFPDNSKLCQMNVMVGFTRGVDSLDDILVTTSAPRDFDMLSVDIDGNDWHVWNALSAYRPRVVIIEYNPSIPNDVIFIQDPDTSINEGCSLAALVSLGKEKGYELCAVTATNGFFIVAEEFPLLNIPDNSIDAMWPTSAGRIFSGYNRKIYHTLSRLGWGGGELTSDCFQKFRPEDLGYKGGGAQRKVRRRPA